MAWVGKRCNCRDEDGRQLGQACPQLSARAHGAWWVRYEAPPEPDGKRRRPWAGPYAKKSDADDAATKLEAAADAGVPVCDAKTRFGAYLEKVWLPAKKTKLKPSTYTSYQEAVRLYYKPGLGHLQMGQVREHHFEELYEAMAQIHSFQGEPSEMLRRLLAARAVATWTRDGEDEPGLWQRRKLTPARIRRIHAVARSAMGTAVKRRVLAHNPAMHVELAQVPRRRPLVWTVARIETWRRTGKRPAPVMVWTPELAGRWLDEIEEDGERLYPLYHLVATRGLRRGEVWALDWDNVELDVRAGVGTLAVREDESDADDQEDGAPEVSVKSDAGWRTVALDATNVGLLAAWRARQAAEQLAAGDAWQGSGRVFTAEGGAPVRIDYIGDHFDVLVARHGVPPIRFHDLRHCAASLMLAAGVDMKVVSATLGHSKYSFTADTYTSVVPELAAAAAEATVAIIPRKRIGSRSA